METLQDDENERVPVEDTDKEQLEAFRERFKMLMEEALSYGITSVVLMCCTDPLDCKTNRGFNRRGSFYEALGLVADYQHCMLTDTE